MKIGVIHSYYRQGVVSGENQIVDELIVMLQGMGHTTDIWRSNSEYFISSKMKQAKRLAEITFLDQKRELFDTWVGKQKSIQLHNLFPALTKSNLETLGQIDKPVVRVVHNHRLTCLNGLHYRNHQVCTDCLMSSNFIPGVVHKCYQNSFISSLGMSGVNFFSNEQKFNDKWIYIAISRYMKEYLIQQGINPEKIELIPNAINPRKSVGASASDVMFSGRLEEEKGLQTILNLWDIDRSLPNLHIIGDGSLRSTVIESSKRDSRIIFHGSLASEQLEKIANSCSVVLVPSLTNETFGRVAIEALSRGQMVVASNRGALADLQMIGQDFLYVDESSDFHESIKRALSSFNEVSSTHAIYFWKENYSPQIISQKWNELYENYE